MINTHLISTKAPQVVGLPQFQGPPLWEASLWAKVCRRSVAERARLPQGTAMQGGITHERIPCGAFVIIRNTQGMGSDPDRPEMRRHVCPCCY